MLSGEAPEPQVAAFLTGIRIKGETSDELLGAVLAVRERMIRWSCARPAAELLDTCGTGGDGAGTVNISTASAVVVAACGVPVVKHGNRAASSRTGSSDVLAELGIAVDGDADTCRRCLDELGITFLFAPLFHPGLRAVAAVRRQLPFRTVINLVGPLCNPAGPGFQLLGVPHEAQAKLVADALARSGQTRRAVVVTGANGLDEVSLDGPTQIQVVEGGEVRPGCWDVADFGLGRVGLADLSASGPAESADRIRRAFSGRDAAVRAIVAANAAAALWTAGFVSNLREGADAATTAIDSGAAAALVERWSACSGSQRPGSRGPVAR
jgi:anthranilate phosphoribosyltransferase